MSLIRGKNTRPEMAVRRELTRLGIRYRLHQTGLPGRPDIVIRRMRIAIFVHGCFWHRHDGCAKTRVPKSRVEFWRQKFAKNIQRDEVVRSELRDLGWNPFVIWECETERLSTLSERLHVVLGHG